MNIHLESGVSMVQSKIQNILQMPSNVHQEAQWILLLNVNYGRIALLKINNNTVPCGFFFSLFSWFIHYTNIEKGDFTVDKHASPSWCLLITFSYNNRDMHTYRILNWRKTNLKRNQHHHGLYLCFAANIIIKWLSDKLKVVYVMASIELFILYICQNGIMM